MSNKLNLKKLALALSMTMAAGFASAGAPDVNITAPIGTVYLTIPSTTNITVTVSHTDTPSGVDPVQNFDVTVDGNSLLGGVVADPFTQTGCNPGMPTMCSVTGSTATVLVPWTVTQPGNYAIVASARHGACPSGGCDTDQESVTVVALVSAEFPAPPAVANAYLNQTYGAKAIKSGVRGCIISQIANFHAMESKYGPKGGPYDDFLIKSDAEAFKVSCGG